MSGSTNGVHPGGRAPVRKLALGFDAGGLATQRRGPPTHPCRPNAVRGHRPGGGGMGSGPGTRRQARFAFMDWPVFGLDGKLTEMGRPHRSPSLGSTPQVPSQSILPRSTGQRWPASSETQRQLAFCRSNCATPPSRTHRHRRCSRAKRHGRDQPPYETSACARRCGPFVCRYADVLARSTSERRFWCLKNSKPTPSDRNHPGAGPGNASVWKTVTDPADGVSARSGAKKRRRRSATCGDSGSPSLGNLTEGPTGRGSQISSRHTPGGQ